MQQQRVVGHTLFSTIKLATTGNHTPLVLPVGWPLRAVMRPVATVPGFLDAVDVQLLTEWRNKYVKSFLTEFVATPEQTAHWLSEAVHKNPGKMLFMVDTPDGERVGHVGLGFIDWVSGYGEADAIVSGGNSPKGLMKAALLTLMRWARDVLGLDTLAVRVRSDNKAVDFYRNVGFQEFKRIALVSTASKQGLNWTESPLATISEPSLVYMRLEFTEN